MHHDNIIQSLRKTIDFDNFNITFSEQTIRQVSMTLKFGGLGLTTYMSPAHHLGTLQCCSHQLVALYGANFTDLYTNLSLDDAPLHPDLEPLFSCIDMFSKI